jgi:nucleotide-binding universal stress UspA family protein
VTNHVKQVFETILVAYDGSPQSQRATDIAFSMAQALGSKLLIFAVIRPPEPAARAELNAILDDAREHYEQSFVLLRERAAKGGLALETEIEVGHPAEHIVHRAEQTHATLIVMGRRGISISKLWMLGSISERVLRYAHCPVTVVQTLPCPFTVTLWKVLGAGVLRSMIRTHLRESIGTDIKQELHLYGMVLFRWSEQVVRKLEALVNSYADAYRVQLQRMTGPHGKNTDLEQIEANLDLLLNWSGSSDSSLKYNGMK